MYLYVKTHNIKVLVYSPEVVIRRVSQTWARKAI